MNHPKSYHRLFLSIPLLLGLACLLIAPLAKVHASEEDLRARQQSMVDAFNKLDVRIKEMEENDPRTKHAKELLKTAEDKKNTFNGLQPSEGETEDFIKAEKAAIEAMNAVNQFFIAPVKPGATSVGKAGTVPGSKEEGGKTLSVTEEFLPYIIRMLFRFTSLAVLIAFVIAGVMMIIAYDNTEYVDKAKRIMYYALIGFAFIALAYAIVRGVTKITF